MSVYRIAAALKLSPSTVSLALRRSPKIPAATRARVIAQAEKIGYRPDAKLTEAMSRLRLAGKRTHEACFAVISFYDSPRPWEKSLHLSRIYRSMEQRAGELGYRLEPLWLRAPGMTYRRFRGILDTRGINGLLCFGSPNLLEEFPTELDHYAIVAQGLSIRTPLHRVMSHFFSDLYRTLDRVWAMGYRRPGLVLGLYEERRSAYAYTSAYLGWCEHAFGSPLTIPLLRMNRVEEKPLLSWLKAHEPDVIIFVHLYDVVNEFVQVLQNNGIRVPRDIGVAAVTQILTGSPLSGMEQNQALMGAWAVELLVSRIMNQDFGIPEHPRIELVESRWVDGRTLKRQSTRS